MISKQKVTYLRRVMEVDDGVEVCLARLRIVEEGKRINKVEDKMS